MPPPPHERRGLLRGDALAVLGAMRELPGCVVTSLPDLGELPGLSVEAWKAWFGRAARLVLEKLPADGVAMFYQSDVRVRVPTETAAGPGQQSEWISKAFLVQQAALEVPGVRLLFHKICPFADEQQQRGGAPAYAPGRPQYSHLLAFAGPAFVERPGAGSPDVFARGAQVWPKGMGVAAAAFAVKWLRAHAPCGCVVDPFVGEGTTLAVANHFGLDALGIDTSVKKLRKAQRLRGAWLFEADGVTPVSEFRQMCWLGDDNAGVPGGEASPSRPNND